MCIERKANGCCDQGEAAARLDPTCASAELLRSIENSIAPVSGHGVRRPRTQPDNEVNLYVKERDEVRGEEYNISRRDAAGPLGRCKSK